MKKKSFLLISPLLFAGILLIMLPIFTFMTLDRLKKQKEFFTERLLEKGISLIRTFEAGTRTGLFTMGWGARRIQTMLFETSLQPEIVYMMITTKDGRILAHSDVSKVGKVFNDMPVLTDINQDISLFHHKIRVQEDNTEVFEVFKQFAPMRRKFQGRHMQRTTPMCGNESPDSLHSVDKQGEGWCQSYLQKQDGTMPVDAQNYIFAGLSMERAQTARARVLKQTVWRGIFFFILGCTGMIALFAFQGYRSARASLTQIEAFSDNVIENMPSGLLTMNLDHKITSMNKTAKDIFGVNLTRLLPQLIKLIKKEDIHSKIIHKQIDFAVAPVSISGKVHNEIENKTIGLDITASSIKDSENRVTGFLFLFKDLTQIRELKQEVETNKRLAAIGKLAAGVAHEIRNPLSSIKGFATYFGERYEENPSDKQTAQIMVKEVERINRSITQLLEFAKPMYIEKKPVDINNLIQHSLKLVHHDIVKKSIETEVDINIKNHTVYTDGDKMNQVLLNLYINAIQAMDENGKLEIMVQDSEQKDFIEIRVKDSGTGIDKASLDLIFDPYFTTRSTGTGLGLSIVHTIIDNLGGTIHVQSAQESKGQGACFTINLPVTE